MYFFNTSDKKQSIIGNHIAQWLKVLSTRKRFAIIMGLVIFVLLFELANFYVAMKIMDGVRVYVQSESLFSKGQKEAYNSLLKYSIDFNEGDYQDFLNFIRTPLGAEKFRQAVSSNPVNVSGAMQALASGGYPTADGPDQIFLYQYFHNLSYMNKAVQIWIQADAKVEEFLIIGQQVHALIITPYDKSNIQEQSIRNEKLSQLMNKASTTDSQLTILENSFSAALGEASRAVKNILVIFAIIITIVLGFAVIIIAIFIQRITIQVEKDKNDFMRIANHQLNTPLSIMKNAYGMVQDKSLNLKEGFRYMGQGLTRAVNVFEDIKTVLEFDGQTKYNIQSHSLLIAINEAVSYAKKTISTNKKDIKIIIEKPTFKIPNVLCDLKQLNNAIYNLLDNAVYYTLQGTIIISYELINSKYLKLSIKDTGIGFTEEDKKNLGQKFYRSKKALLSHPDGSGLGLYIARNTIEHQKGQLFFKSEGEGKGSTFGFILPIIKK